VRSRNASAASAPSSASASAHSRSQAASAGRTSVFALDPERSGTCMECSLRFGNLGFSGYGRGPKTVFHGSRTVPPTERARSSLGPSASFTAASPPSTRPSSIECSNASAPSAARAAVVASSYTAVSAGARRAPCSSVPRLRGAPLPVAGLLPRRLPRQGRGCFRSRRACSSARRAEARSAPSPQRDRILLKQSKSEVEIHPVDGKVKASVETSGNLAVMQRLTATRLVSIGVFALAAPKKTVHDTRQLLFLIEASGMGPA
jgi:hypothetical protein